MPTRAKHLVRGLMLDPARLTEKHSFYFDMLPQMAAWGFNTLWWHFVDSQGFVLKLAGHPELASPYAFTKAEVRRFVAAAARYGIDVVPEVESLGHARYITGLPQYAHLANGPDSLCPSHPQTLELLGEIIPEVAELFPSPYFHAGLDEVDVLTGCPRCVRRRKGRPHWFPYAELTPAVHSIVTACGKRMIMWGDHVEKDPEMLDVLPRDIVIAHWHYWHVPVDAIQRSIDMGYDVFLAPAVCRYGDAIQPNLTNFQNLDEMSAAAAKLRNAGVSPARLEAIPATKSKSGGATLGMVNTWWCPWRGLREAYMFACAYTGAVLRAGRPVEKKAFARRYAADYFGLADPAAAGAMWRVHELMVMRPEFIAMMYDSPSDVINAIAMANAEGFDARAAGMQQCVAALEAAAGKVRTHRPQYAAAVLAAKIASACLDQAMTLKKVHALSTAAELNADYGNAARAAVDRKEIAGIFAALHRRLASLCAAATKEWRRTRHDDDPLKSLDLSKPCGPDVMLGRMVRCLEFLRIGAPKMFGAL